MNNDMEVQDFASSMQESAEAYILSLQNHTVWEEDATAQFVCRLCKKTFYNANALQNHKNLQHDVESSGSDDELQSATSLAPADQGVNGICNFKFIPLRRSHDMNEILMQEDGITTRMFTEDTTFLIVKVEGDDIDIDAVKRRRLEGVVRRTQMKPVKQTIDLRGPFTCTFPSTLRPDLQCRQIFFNCCEYSLHYREEHTKRRKAALRCQVCERRLDREPWLGLTSAAGAPLAPAPAPAPALARLVFPCRVCGQTFLDSLSYEEHTRAVHAKTKPHQCAVCAKRFTQQGGLQQHMRMHTGVRPFACTFCPKAFTQKAGLDQHLRTHTKIKPFKCVICSKCFSQSVHLRQHMRTHTNIQPFECAVCGRRFKQSSHLNFHMRSHAGECAAGVMEQLERLAGAGAGAGAGALSLARLQPVRDGDTLYYAAELAARPEHYNYQPDLPTTEDYPHERPYHLSN